MWVKVAEQVMILDTNTMTAAQPVLNALNLSQVAMVNGCIEDRIHQNGISIYFLLKLCYFALNITTAAIHEVSVTHDNWRERHLRRLTNR